MRRPRSWLIAGAVLLSACAAGPPLPEPAKPVELSRYLGRWYEIARTPNMFERGCEAVTADYALRADGLISGTNSCRKGALTGPLKQAQGRAKVAGGGGAKLKVSFFGPFFSDYWVLDRAPDYSWALVGGRNGWFWILSREPRPANREALIRRAEALGYPRERMIFPHHRVTPDGPAEAQP